MNRTNAKFAFRLILAASPALTTLDAAEFEITRSTFDGGAVRSAGGRFELSGTIGQPDAGESSGGRFSLTGGFWFEVDRGDCNEDGAIGLVDYRGFQACLMGPTAVIGDECRCFDLDLNGTVDLADFAELQTTIVGE